MDNIDSIIFDLDGTLWNALDSTIETLKEIKKRHKEITKEITKDDIMSCMGLTFEETAEKYYGYLSKNEREKYTKEAIEENSLYLKKHGAKLYKGLQEVIKTLSQNYSLYIVSNCIESYLDAFFATSNLKEYFKDYETNGRTGLSKGENIKLLVKRNKLKRAIYVGDTKKDQEAAIEANIPFIFASYGFGNVTTYDYKIESLSDLLKM